MQNKVEKRNNFITKKNKKTKTFCSAKQGFQNEAFSLKKHFHPKTKIIRKKVNKAQKVYFFRKKIKRCILL